MFIGILILLTGVLFLLKNLGLIQGSFWGWFIPVVLIAMGAGMILKRPHKKTEK